jgi:hypothetical protein
MGAWVAERPSQAHLAADELAEIGGVGGVLQLVLAAPCQALAWVQHAAGCGGTQQAVLLTPPPPRAVLWVRVLMQAGQRLDRGCGRRHGC